MKLALNRALPNKPELIMKPTIAQQARSADDGASVRLALIGLALSTVLASLATSSANVALPTLAQAFSASFQAVQWVVLAYLLAITTLIVSAGRLGDMIGRRRLLLAGIFLFTFASLMCGIAPTLALLIGARAAQGIGAAIMMALTMAFVSEMVPKAKTGSAMGLLGTMSAIGTALGPSLGGVLIAGLGWRALFLVNLPLGTLTFFLAMRHLPADRQAPPADRPGYDYAGTVVARPDPGRVCIGADRQVRGAQRGATAGRGYRHRPVCPRAETGAIPAGPAGDVARPRTRGKPGHERARVDGDDGDAW